MSTREPLEPMNPSNHSNPWNPSNPDRRAVPRFNREADQAVMRIRIRPGYEASMLNISAGGALVEGLCRLMPGSTVDLQITGRTERIALRGLVMRCTISRLWAASIWYCGALAFDRQLPWLPDGESRESRESRESGESVLCEQLTGLVLPRALASHAAR
jgi:PilZ domain